MFTLVQLVLLAGVLASVGYVAYQVLSHLWGQERKLVEEEQRQALAQARTEAAIDREGALPTHPIYVASAASIEPRAESEPCPICGGRLHVAEHVTQQLGGRRLRRLTMRCGGCGRRSRLFFELRESRPN